MTNSFLKTKVEKELENEEQKELENEDRREQGEKLVQHLNIVSTCHLFFLNPSFHHYHYQNQKDLWNQLVELVQHLNIVSTCHLFLLNPSFHYHQNQKDLWNQDFELAFRWLLCRRNQKVLRMKYFLAFLCCRQNQKVKDFRCLQNL